MIQTIYEHYGLRPNEFMPVGKFEGFQYRDILYTIINVKQMEQDELNELYQMSQFLMGQGDRHVATFMPNLNGEMITETETEKFIICRCLAEEKNPNFSPGHELAVFHQKGDCFLMKWKKQTG
ncbi:hypothetical protein MUB15_20740 [Priestia sp. OVS21]|nr:hypothetical protein [Priestia sp. OVS21]